MSTPETAAAVVAAVAYQNIRRLSSSSPSPLPNENIIYDDDGNKDKWAPFGSKSEFYLDISLVLCFMVFSILGVFGLNYCINRFINNKHPTDQESERLKQLKLQKMAKSTGPTLEFSSGTTKLAGAETVCAICLSEFVNGEMIRVLRKCNHGFHVKCIETWFLASHTSCPTCRAACISKVPEIICDEDLEDVDVDLESAGSPSSSSCETTAATTVVEQRIFAPPESVRP